MWPPDGSLSQSISPVRPQWATVSGMRFANGAAAQGLYQRGVLTAVTNLIPSPTDISASWGNTSAGVVQTPNKATFTGNVAQQVGAILSSQPAGKYYLTVVQARCLSTVDNGRSVLYPGFNINLRNNTLAYDLQTEDYVYGGTAGGNWVSLRPQMSYHFARFFSPDAGAIAIGLNDPGNVNNQTWSADIQFVGLYDITGLSGVIYDATANKYFDLGTNVNLIGDSMGLHLYQVRDTLGLAKTNINGSFLTTGNQISGSPIITGIPSTAAMAIGDSFYGTRMPFGAKILSVDSLNQVTLDTNALTTIANNQYTTGFYGSGKGTTKIAIGMLAKFTSNPTLAMQPSLIWMGHNNPVVDPVTLAQAKTDFVSLTNAMQGDFRILAPHAFTSYVINGSSVPTRTASADYIDQLNAWLSAYYGPRYINVNDWLAAASNGSVNDLLSVSANAVPASLLAEAFPAGMHVNNRGSDVVADAVAAAIGTSWS